MMKKHSDAAGIDDRNEVREADRGNLSVLNRKKPSANEIVIRKANE